MFELPHVVRAVRQMVIAKGVGLEFMGSGPLVLAAPGQRRAGPEEELQWPGQDGARSAFPIKDEMAANSLPVGQLCAATGSLDRIVAGCGGSRSWGSRARGAAASAKGSKNAGDAAQTLNGFCASFVAQMGSCSGAAPGSTCPTTHRRAGEPFKHKCPAEQHKAAACKKFKPKDLVAAAKALTGKK